MNKPMKLATTALGLMLAAGAAQAQVTCGANTGAAATGAAATWSSDTSSERP